jgi:hypothetical protein
MTPTRQFSEVHIAIRVASAARSMSSRSGLGTKPAFAGSCGATHQFWTSSHVQEVGGARTIHARVVAQPNCLGEHLSAQAVS